MPKTEHYEVTVATIVTIRGAAEHREIEHYAVRSVTTGDSGHGVRVLVAEALAESSTKALAHAVVTGKNESKRLA